MRRKRYFEEAINEIDADEPAPYDTPAWDLPGHQKRKRQTRRAAVPKAAGEDNNERNTKE